MKIWLCAPAMPVVTTHASHVYMMCTFFSVMNQMIGLPAAMCVFKVSGTKQAWNVWMAWHRLIYRSKNCPHSGKCHSVWCSCIFVTSHNLSLDDDDEAKMTKNNYTHETLSSRHLHSTKRDDFFFVCGLPFFHVIYEKNCVGFFRLR